MIAIASGNVDQNVGQTIPLAGDKEQSGQMVNASAQLMDNLLNGTPTNTNALPLSQCHNHGSFLSAFVPDKLKSQIWDKKYIEVAQLYQSQSVVKLNRILQ